MLKALKYSCSIFICYLLMISINFSAGAANTSNAKTVTGITLSASSDETDIVRRIYDVRTNVTVNDTIKLQFYRGSLYCNTCAKNYDGELRYPSCISSGLSYIGYKADQYRTISPSDVVTPSGYGVGGWMYPRNQTVTVQIPGDLYILDTNGAKKYSYLQTNVAAKLTLTSSVYSHRYILKCATDKSSPLLALDYGLATTGMASINESSISITSFRCDTCASYKKYWTNTGRSYQPLSVQYQPDTSYLVEKIGGPVTDLTFKNCTFTGMPSWLQNYVRNGAVHINFENCIFNNVTLSSGISKYINCTFVNSTIKSGTGTFLNCDYTGSTLQNTATEVWDGGSIAGGISIIGNTYKGIIGTTSFQGTIIDTTKFIDTPNLGSTNFVPYASFVEKPQDFLNRTKIRLDLNSYQDRATISSLTIPNNSGIMWTDSSQVNATISLEGNTHYLHLNTWSGLRNLNGENGIITIDSRLEYPFEIGTNSVNLTAKTSKPISILGHNSNLNLDSLDELNTGKNVQISGASTFRCNVFNLTQGVFNNTSLTATSIDAPSVSSKTKFTGATTFTLYNTSDNPSTLESVNFSGTTTFHSGDGANILIKSCVSNGTVVDSTTNANILVDGGQYTGSTAFRSDNAIVKRGVFTDYSGKSTFIVHTDSEMQTSMEGSKTITTVKLSNPPVIIDWADFPG